jgi:GTP cyclohydrolase I
MLSILSTGMDLTDDSLRHANRVAKMFVKKFWRFKSFKKPKASTFDNNYKWRNARKNIIVYSTCEHHLLPIIGRAHVAYKW